MSDKKQTQGELPDFLAQRYVFQRELGQGAYGIVR